MLLCRDHIHPEITNFTRVTVLRFCWSMNDGHDAICNMELLIIFFDGASTGLGLSLDCCRLIGRGIIAYLL